MAEKAVVSHRYDLNKSVLAFPCEGIDGNGLAMMRGTTVPDQRQSSRFLLLYALATAGGSASYAPFLTLILPARAAVIAPDQTVEVISYCAFVGAIAASLANIFFGWLSDRTRNRRGWIALGLAGSCTLLIAMGRATSVGELLVLLFAWQVALNMMLNPLSAWAGDCVPDQQKGTLGGLLSIAPGMGALVGTLVTTPGLVGADMRPALIALLVSAMILPALLAGQPTPMPHLVRPRGPRPERLLPGTGPFWPLNTVGRMWLARLLLQIAEAALFAFLFLWLSKLDDRLTDNNVANIFTLVLFTAVPLAIGAGRWSDRAGRPMLPLIVSATTGTIALSVMSLSDSVPIAIGAYLVFGISAAVFLALHSSQTLRVLPRPEHRGRDLGIFNLTNTIPSLVMPGIALALIPLFGFQALFLILAALVGSAALLLLATRRK